MTKFLILDLDETLVHSFEKERKDDFSDHIIYDIGELSTIFRNGLCDFLETMSKVYSLNVWSAGTEPYVISIVNLILDMYPGINFDYVLTREHCESRVVNIDDEVCLEMIKPLSVFFDIVKDANYTNTILVDNKPNNAFDNVSNLVYIPDFDGQHDEKLYEVGNNLIMKSLEDSFL